MGNGSPKAAPLPKGASEALKKFVACEEDSVKIDTTELDWMPKPFGDFGPSITVALGAGPNQVVISYGIIDLPASIGADGLLSVDTSDAPSVGPLSLLGEGINKWVDAFNETMKANKKKLDSVQVNGTKVSLTKAMVAVPANETLVTPPVGIPVQPETPPDKPDSEPDDKSLNKGCWQAIFGFLILIMIALVVGLIALTGGDDDNTVVTAPPTTGPVVDDSAAESVLEDSAAESVVEDSAAESVVEDVPVPPRIIGADFFPLEPFTGDQAWNVATETNLGPSTLDPPVEVRFFLRSEMVQGGYPYMFLLSPFPEGAVEFWFVGEDGVQTGSTTFVPGSEDLPNFGVGQGQGDAFPCAGGVVILGSAHGPDPRTMGSWGIGTYSPLGPDDGFPEGSTATDGAFLGDVPPMPVFFAIDPETGAIDYPEESDFLSECLNGPDSGAISSNWFFAPPDESNDSEASGVAGPGGELFLVVPDPPGDTFLCDDPSVPATNLWSDIAGLAASREGDTVSVAVTMYEPPTTRGENFSSSVVVRVITEGNVQYVYFNQLHDGEPTSGEVVGDDVDPEALDTSIDENAIFFSFDLPAADQIAILAAQAINMRVEGDAPICDDTLGEPGDGIGGP